MATAGLGALTGILEVVCGDLVVNSRSKDGITSLQMKMSHSEQFKKDVKAYVKRYNKLHGTGITIAFPKPFLVRVQERKRSARAAPSRRAPEASAK
jgi:hypothetical protein